jgi:hypothetical protein
MLWKQFVCIVGDDGSLTEPPEAVLSLIVIDGIVYLTTNTLDDKEQLGPDGRHIQTPSRALLHALTSAIAADEDPQLRETQARLTRG